MDLDLVVTGKVIRHDSTIENGCIAVRDGRIGAVGDGYPPAERRDFGSGMILAGAIDAPVHCLSHDGSNVLAEPGSGQFMRPPLLPPERQSLL